MRRKNTDKCERTAGWGIEGTEKCNDGTRRRRRRRMAQALTMSYGESSQLIQRTTGDSRVRATNCGQVAPISGHICAKLGTLGRAGPSHSAAAAPVDASVRPPGQMRAVLRCCLLKTPQHVAQEKGPLPCYLNPALSTVRCRLLRS